MNNEDFFKPNNKNNKSSILLILIISIFIFGAYMLVILLAEKFNKVNNINQSDIIFLLNLILSIMGIVSCLLSYNSNKKEEVFIMSLMYTIFAVDILNSLSTGYLNNASSRYYALLTSIIRVLIIYISVSNLTKLKKIITTNKYKSILIVALTSLICIHIEYLYMYPYSRQITLFYKNYNLMIIILYMFIAFKYFKTSIIKGDYIYGVIGSSAILFSIKSIYEYYCLINPSITNYALGYSTIILAFIVYIIEIFIELNRTIKINTRLDEQRSLFIKIIDENKQSNVIICDENYIINYKNKKSEQSLEEIRETINAKHQVGDKLELEKIFNYEVTLEEIELEVLSSKSFRKSVYVEYNDSILDFSVQIFEINNNKFKIITINDISAKYKLEKALLEYEIMKKEEIVKNEFFSNISHELKTPLNVIYSTNQLLNNTLPRDDFKEIYSRHSESVNINCKRMLRLIDNIVDITKLDVGYKNPNFQNYDIVNVVEDMTLSVVNYANSKEIDIIFDTDIEELNIKFDLDMLERIVLNLLSNSIKFSHEKSTIVVKIFNNEDWVGIKVIDEGIGIDEELQSKIFDRFVQGDKSIRRKKEGSGIGLSLVKSFVELMDGKVYVESDGNRGSEFTVLLPNQVILDNGSVSYNNYNVDEERIQLEFSDIYELFENK